MTERTRQLDELIVEDPILMELNSVEKIQELGELVLMGAKTLAEYEPGVDHMVVVRVGWES